MPIACGPTRSRRPISARNVTFSNLGMYGVTYFTAVINRPQAAIPPSARSRARSSAPASSSPPHTSRCLHHRILTAPTSRISSRASARCSSAPRARLRILSRLYCAGRRVDRGAEPPSSGATARRQSDHPLLRAVTGGTSDRLSGRARRGVLTCAEILAVVRTPSPPLPRAGVPGVSRPAAAGAGRHGEPGGVGRLLTPGWWRPLRCTGGALLRPAGPRSERGGAFARSRGQHECLLYRRDRPRRRRGPARSAPRLRRGRPPPNANTALTPEATAAAATRSNAGRSKRRGPVPKSHRLYRQARALPEYPARFCAALDPLVRALRAEAAGLRPWGTAQRWDPGPDAGAVQVAVDAHVSAPRELRPL